VKSETRTVCPYCGVGCGLLVRTEGGRVRSVAGDPIHPVNRGRTCRKPLELPAAVHARDRALTPLVRSARDCGLSPTDWPSALTHVAARMRELDPSEIAFYISGQLLTEDYYAVTKLAKGFLGTNNVDSNSRLCMSSAVAGYVGAFGTDGPPPSYADIARTDCMLLLGTNTAACHPIVWSRIRDRQAEGAFVICADPRPTPTARGSDIHLPVRPGTDLPLLNAMLCVLDEEGLVDRDFVRLRTSGFEETLAAAREWPLARAAEVCGVDGALIAEAARRFGSARAAMTLWSMGANQSTVGTLKNRALINLCLATGNLGRAGAGPLSLTGQPNAMGGRETGGLAHLLPGYRRVDVADDRAAMEVHWGVPPGRIPDTPGLDALSLFDALGDGRVKAVWIVATNPVVSLPDSARVRRALERAELVIVQDAYHPTETSALADVVLPAAAWPEKQGTMTNSERRVGFVARAVDPPGEAWPDWRIFAAVARELGFAEAFAWEDEAAVYDEFAACTAGRVCDVSSFSHELLRRKGSAQWGGPRLDPRRARFAPTPHAPPADAVCDEYPLLLTTGRVADQWHTMTRTGKSRALRDAAGEPFVELHPDDAPVEDGDLVRVVSRRGEVRLRARITEGIAPGVAFAPFHWGALHASPGAGALNVTTHGSVDPTSKQPELKALAVRVEPLSREEPVRAARGATPTRLVVVGTGMAGLAVVEAALRRRPAAEWRITMLGEEPGPAYNRMLVSKLLARTCGPGDLELRPLAWYAAAGIDLRGGSPATAIDLDGRVVVDRSGGRHPYDALVLATGSRPFVPPIPGAAAAHVHVLRSPRDVDALAAAAPACRSAVVVGGGLLGLEAAAGLLARGVPTTVVELADRLMPHQLDAGAAALLRGALEEQGLRFALGCSVARIEHDRVVLDGGREIEASLVVAAAGVRPNVSLAGEAGLHVARGVVVDDELRASAPSVWAVGECAEHRATVYGLWAPIAEQASVAGAVVAGDPAAFHGAIPATTLKIAGVGLFSGGRADASVGEDEVLASDTRHGTYRKLILDGDRLAGALLVGDVAEARELSALVRSGDDVPPRLLEVGAVSSSQPRDHPQRVVCTCNAVTAGEIADAIRRGGLRTLAQVSRATRAATGCGSCAADVEQLLARSSARNTDETVAKPLAGRMAA
jgi:ferredoxin-nitrate reductase